MSYQVLLAVLKVPHHLHHPSGGHEAPGRKEGGRENKGALPPAEAATAASRQRAAGRDPAPVLAAPGGGGSSDHPAGAAADPRPGGAAAGRLRGEGLRLACGGQGGEGETGGRLSGAGCEGTARHRRRDEGPAQRRRELRALPLPAPMAPPQRGLPAPRPLSGTEPRSIQRGGGRCGPQLRGWLPLSPPHPRERRVKEGGCGRGGGSLRPPPPLEAPDAPPASPRRSTPRQPRLRLPRPPRHPTHFIGRIAQVPALGCFRRRSKSASPRFTRRECQAPFCHRCPLRSAASAALLPPRVPPVPHTPPRLLGSVSDPRPRGPPVTPCPQPSTQAERTNSSSAPPRLAIALNACSILL